MRKLLICLLLVSYFHCWLKPCDHNEYPIELNTISPDPLNAIIGSTISVRVSGTNAGADLTTGKIVINACKMAICDRRELSIGQMGIVFSRLWNFSWNFYVDARIPPGKYDVKIQVFDSTNTLMGCVKTRAIATR